MQDRADLILCTLLVALSVLATGLADQQSAVWWGSTSTACMETPAGRGLFITGLHGEWWLMFKILWKVCITMCISHDSVEVSPEVTILERRVFLLSTALQGYDVMTLYVASARSARCRSSRSGAAISAKLEPSLRMRLESVRAWTPNSAGRDQ